MSETLTLALAVATLAQTFFCISILILKSMESRNHLLLVGIFVAICFASGGPVVEAFAPNYLHLFYHFTLPAYLSITPILWFYTCWLTAEQAWSFERKHIVHLIPAAIALFVVAIPVAFGWVGNNPDPRQMSLVPLLFYSFVGIVSYVLLFFWPVQSAIYVFRIYKRVAAYRIRLKEYFASDEGRGLSWLTAFLAVFGLAWLAALATILRQNVFGAEIMSRELGSALFLVLVWTLGLWGLSQRPGFEGNYLEDEHDDGQDQGENGHAGEEGAQQKYKRSALDEDQAKRIAGKIEAAMAKDKIYLDPSLSLNKLSRHLMVSPNHISQTLNETVGECFFDYVNGWRIREAQPRILEGKDTVLAIALDVGFNARSSFYKAFKRETGKTPSDYRKTAA